VGEAADGATALAVIAREKPHLVTMDLQMPGRSGFEAIEEIMAKLPVPILVVTGQSRGSRPVRTTGSDGSGVARQPPARRRRFVGRFVALRSGAHPRSARARALLFCRGRSPWQRPLRRSRAQIAQLSIFRSRVLAGLAVPGALLRAFAAVARCLVRIRAGGPCGRCALPISRRSIARARPCALATRTRCIGQAPCPTRKVAPSRADVGRTRRYWFAVAQCPHLAAAVRARRMR
jgi:CheY-like chemotaxis protein